MPKTQCAPAIPAPVLGALRGLGESVSRWSLSADKWCVHPWFDLHTEGRMGHAVPEGLRACAPSVLVEPREVSASGKALNLDVMICPSLGGEAFLFSAARRIETLCQTGLANPERSRFSTSRQVRRMVSRRFHANNLGLKGRPPCP